MLCRILWQIYKLQYFFIKLSQLIITQIIKTAALFPDTAVRVYQYPTFAFSFLLTSSNFTDRAEQMAPAYVQIPCFHLLSYFHSYFFHFNTLLCRPTETGATIPAYTYFLTSLTWFSLLVNYQSPKPNTAVVDKKPATNQPIPFTSFSISLMYVCFTQHLSDFIRLTTISMATIQTYFSPPFSLT